MEDIDSLKTELVNKDALTLRQLLLSKVEDVDEIKRSQDQQFNGKSYYSYVKWFNLERNKSRKSL